MNELVIKNSKWNNTKTKFKNLFTSEKLFWYRLIGVILVFLFLVWNFLLIWKGDLYNNPAIYGGHKPLISQRFSIYYSYFTTQTNYIVFFYFVFYLFHKRFKNTKPDYLIRLGVTVYITMTMIVFWCGLLTQGDIMKNSNLYSWSSTIVLHAIIPIAMITSYVVTCGETYYKYEDHHKGAVWLIALYPVLYLIAILIRGEMLHLDHPNIWNSITGSHDPYFYPYFFLDYSQTSGFEIFTTGCVLVLVLCIGAQYFYIMVNNLCFFRNVKKHNLNNIDINHIKLWSKIKKHRLLNKRGKIAVIINFISSTANLVVALLFFALRGFWNSYFHNQYNSNIIFAFSAILIVFSLLSILFGILSLFNLYYARIVLGFLSIAMICFNWIWIAGPLFDLIVAVTCLSEKKWTKKEYEKYLKNYETKLQEKKDFISKK